MIFQELKNPLENRVTILRVVRSVFPNTEIDITPIEWQKTCHDVYNLYTSLSDVPLSKVLQKRLFGGSKKKKSVACYPIEFIPIIINIVKESFGSKIKNS